jgi:hypothetical protein
LKQSDGETTRKKQEPSIASFPVGCLIYSQVAKLEKLDTAIVLNLMYLLILFKLIPTPLLHPELEQRLSSVASRAIYRQITIDS